MLHVKASPPSRLSLVRVIDVLTSGNHHPLLCELEGEVGGVGLWVVKPQDTLSGGTRDGRANVVAELATAEVCAWVGVQTPEIGTARLPAVIVPEVTAAVPAALRSEVITVLKMNANKLAFCSRFLQTAVVVDPDTLRGKRGAAAARRWGRPLFGVDLYIRHDDRRVENPNAVWYRDEIVAIDNGGAFAGIDRPGVTGAEIAARIVIPSPAAFKSHVFFAALARLADDLAWPELAAQLSAASEEEIDALAASWSSELDPFRTIVADYLKARRRGAAEVVEQAARLLEVKK